jgi:hypothetical protein
MRRSLARVFESQRRDWFLLVEISDVGDIWLGGVSPQLAASGPHGDPNGGDERREPKNADDDCDGGNLIA